MTIILIISFIFLLIIYPHMTNSNPEVDLYSDKIDPIVTIEYLETLEVGCLFPKVQGVATACYAHQRFPMLSLEEAVQKYIEERNYQRDHLPPPPVKVMRVYDYVTKVDGVRIVDWDNDRDGRCVAKVFAKNFWQKGPGDINVDYEFDVDNVVDATELCKKVINDVKTSKHPKVQEMIQKYGVKGLHFSGPMIFVSGNLDEEEYSDE
jgi:hypothetical protein